MVPVIMMNAMMAIYIMVMVAVTTVKYRMNGHAWEVHPWEEVHAREVGHSIQSSI